ncbi:SH3 and multiple ankyrin repeat domains protein 3-like isoform X3 [Branchiostoma floridae]|uniref:SH3 and multiple ankyrin repeat domains protein 3-like isoform X3 n=1 Tax=Branchiostoma floridae TaxID=7739 RepID=A0A9J7KHH4_BRAFL|nr:SH3 and multiple ankyrin repeat domains protein 3-like isoform X3 [Branchiostoma floridae]
MGTTEPIHGVLDDGGENTVLVRVAIPDRHIQKCFRFRTDDTVWAAKQMVLTQLDRREMALHDGVNYGFFLPPENGRAGKFLDEGRLFDEYPLKGPIGYLEFKYKRRVYMAIDIDEKGLQRLHTRANLRRFLEHVRSRALDKVFRLLKKGLDPNFHEPEKGETPLTTAAMLEGSTDMIVTLVEGGAHKDFRAKDGMTPLHRAARKGNYKALKSLLELGSSPDYKDARNLTSLYHCCMMGGNPTCCEILLHNHADPHVADEQGWQPMHQACRHGHVQHLEHLLFYGADHTAQNASGNTPLHVCALYNQEPCTRVLLFRGARRDIKNYSNQTPFQVAAVAGNFDLGEIIKKHECQDVDLLPTSPVEVQFREAPKYNNRRRASVALSKHLGILHRTRSCGTLDLSNLRSLSPSPSMTSLQSLGTLSLQSSLNMAPHSQHHHSNGTPAMSVSSTNSSPANSQPSTPTPGSPVTNRSATLNREDLENVKKRMYTALPGRQFVAVKKYVPREVGELALAKGDKVTVLGIGEQGFWEGRVGSNEGWFPSDCVEELSNKPTTVRKVKRRAEYQGSLGRYRRLSSHSVANEYLYYRDTVRQMKRDDPPRTASPIKAFTIGRSSGLRISETRSMEEEEEMKKLQGNPPKKETLAPNTLRNMERNVHVQGSHMQRERASTVSRASGLRMTEFTVSSNTEAGVKALREQRMHRAKTAPVLPLENSYNKPRTAVLKRDQHGFGFVLRGAKTLNPNVPFTPTLAHPALQYMESIDPNSVAERAGLKKGDFLLQINGEDVRRFTHAQVVELIRESRDVVVMTVVTVDPQLRAALQRQKDAQKRISIAVSSPRDQDEIVDLRREDTIAKEFLGSPDGGGRNGGGEKSPNVTKARASSMVAEMTIDDKDLENLQSQLARRGSLNNMEGTRTATLRSRPSSKRVTTAELEDLFQRQDSDYQSPRALGIQPSDPASEYQCPRTMGGGKPVPVPTVPRGKAVPVPVVPKVSMPPLPPKQRPQSAREKIATPRAAPEVEDTTVGNIVVEKIRKDSISSSTTDSNSLSNASDSAPTTPTTPNYSEITVSFDSSVRRKVIPPPKPSHPPPPPPRTVSSSFRTEAIESKATTLPASYQDPNLHHQIKMAILNRQDSTQSLHVPQEQRRVPDMMRSNSVGGIEPQEVGNQRAALQRRVHSVTFDGTHQVREIDMYDDGQNERSYSTGGYQTPNVNAGDRHLGQGKSQVESRPIVRRDVSRTERVEQSPRTRTKKENVKATEHLREKLERSERREETETELDSEEGKTGLALELARAVKARKQKEKSNARDQRQEVNASPKQAEPMKKKEIASKLEAQLQRHTSTDALPPTQPKSNSPLVQNKVGAYRAQVVVNHSTDDLRRSPGAAQHPDSPRSRQPISMYEQEGCSPDSSSPLAIALAARARYERSSNEHLDQVEGATGDAAYEERAAHLTPIRDWYFENEEYVDMSPDMNYDTDLALALEKRRSEIGELEGVPAYNVGIEEKIERHRQAATRGEQSNSNAALLQAMAARRARMAGGETDSNDDLPLPFDLPPPVMPEELLAAAEGLSFDEPLPPPPEFSESDQKTSYSSPAHNTHAYYTSDLGLTPRMDTGWKGGGTLAQSAFMTNRCGTLETRNTAWTRDTPKVLVTPIP